MTNLAKHMIRAWFTPSVEARGAFTSDDQVLEQSHRAHRRASLAGDDEVVEHGEIDCFTGQREAAGDLSIEGAGGRIAARVVVGEDHARAAVDRCIGDDPAQRQFAPAIIAVMPREVDAPRLIIDVGDPQMFPGRIGLGEAIGEESPGRFEAVESQR